LEIGREESTSGRRWKGYRQKKAKIISNI